MKKKFGKFLSILLTAVMLVGMLPATAFADDRTVVSKVDASLDRDITPGHGELAEDPAFTVTDGQPAYFEMGGWRKKAGDDWILVAYNDHFSEGTYRYEVQVRIDGEGAKTHVLSGNNDVTVKVNGERWETIQDVRAGGGDDGYSYMVVASDEFPVSAPENLELTFHDSSVFDIKKSFKGHKIQSYFVAQNVEGGTKPYAFSKVSGPAWISVSAEGEISGTPDAVGENADLVVQVTDSKGAEATITIKVAETVLSNSDREDIKIFEAKSLSGDITPKYGSTGAVKPEFTVIKGQPAYLYDIMGYYIKKDGDSWKDIDVPDTIDEGTYRYKGQLRIDGDNGGNEYVLFQGEITVTVDGKVWEVDYPVLKEGKASWVWVMSPELTVKKPVIKALDVKGIKAPVDGETADTSGIIINNGNGITVSEAKWKKGDESLVDKFEANEPYYLHINYAVDDDYTVANDAAVMHDLTGGIANHNASVKTIVIEYTVPETYAVTVTTDGNGTAEASVTRAAAGTTVTLTATPNEGYEFDKLEIISPVAFTLPNNSFTMPDNDVVVKASFKEKAAAPVETYTVTVTADVNGIAVADVTEAKEGDTVTLTAEANEGYEFDRWEVVSAPDGTIVNIENGKFTMPAGAVTVKAIFKEKAAAPVETYTVTVENGTGDGEYAAGAEVTIKADSKSGYKFDKWIVESDVEVEIDVNDSETTFTMPAGDVKVTADYDKKSSGSSSSSGSKKYKVTVEDTDNGSVESSRTKASKGTTVTITVDPDAGYEMDDIVVETKAGKEVDVKDKGNGTFTFKMPAANVIVSVDFAKADVEDSDAKDEVEYIQLTIDSVIAWVFDEYVANDVAPVIRNERTMLPARFVAEALGGVVTWNEVEQKVTIVNGEDTIVIFIGEPFATVNGTPVELDSPAFIENSRTYLPIRFIAENMGATVTWDAAERTVTIVPGE